MVVVITILVVVITMMVVEITILVGVITILVMVITTLVGVITILVVEMRRKMLFPSNCVRGKKSGEKADFQHSLASLV